MRGLLRSVLTGGVGAGLVVGAMNLPFSLDVSAPVAAAATDAKVGVVTRSDVVCAGPESLGVSGLAASAAQQQVAVLAASAPLTVLPASARPALGGPGGSVRLSGLPAGGSWPPVLTRRAAPAAGTVATARSVSVAAVGGIAPGTVAVQRELTLSGARRTMSTGACGPAVSEAWLVAGGAQPGRRERLVLANPAANAVTVDVEVLGTLGRVQSPSGRGVVVAGRGRTAVLLDGIAGTEQSPVVHVTVRGGTVAATLNDTWLDGVVPRGGDDATALVPPSREQLVPGVALDGAGFVRVGVPGEDEAVVQIRVLTPDGPRPLPQDGVVRVAGGASRDVALSGLAPGAYAVQVRADRPVVAAALVERRKQPTGPSDLAWSAAAPAVTTAAGLPLPAPTTAGLASALHLAATGEAATVRVSLVAADGRARVVDVRVGEDSTEVVALGASTSVWLTPMAGTVRAAVVSTLSQAAGQLVSSTSLGSLVLTAVEPALVQLP